MFFVCNFDIYIQEKHPASLLQKKPKTRLKFYADRKSVCFWPLSTSITQRQTARPHTLQLYETEQASFFLLLSSFQLWLDVRKVRTFYMLQKYFISGSNTVLMKILYQLWVHVLAPYLTQAKSSSVSSLCAYVASSLWDSNMTYLFTVLHNVNHWCTWTLAKWSKLHVNLQIILQHIKEREVRKSEGKCSKCSKVHMMRDL
jgi:hypothetical protein